VDYTPICIHVTAYSPGLHISKATKIKIVAYRVCPRLPIWYATKKKGLKLYYCVEMPTKKIMVEVVNIPKNWSSLFNGKRLIQDPDMYDAKKS